MVTAHNKKTKLIHAAVEVIKEHGFEKTAVSQIVKRAGVAQGTFYLYFQSKNELVPAIAGLILNEQLQQIQTEYANKPDSLDQLIDTLLEVTYSITEQYKELITFIYSGMAFYHAFETWEEIYKPYYSWLENELEKLRHQGSVKQHGSISYLAHFTVGLVEHGAESFYLSNAGSKNPDTSKKELSEFLTDALSQ